jgi:hypothetical protein
MLLPTIGGNGSHLMPLADSTIVMCANCQNFPGEKFSDKRRRIPAPFLVNIADARSGATSCTHKRTNFWSID